MCVDGGVFCVPLAIKLAGMVGLGGIATRIWHKCRIKKRQSQPVA